MLSELVRGIIPANWHRYTVPKGCTVIQWITDFSQRVKQLQQISKVVSTSGAKELQVKTFSVVYEVILKINDFFQSFPVWLGGLLNPEAWITATRQCVAQANSWSLEELHLDVTITDSHDTSTIPHDCFAVVGKIENF